MEKFQDEVWQLVLNDLKSKTYQLTATKFASRGNSLKKV
jgi:hypothetical protein